MAQKPFYYDGSDLTVPEGANKDLVNQQNLQMTDEMRANIGRNPYIIEDEE